VEDGDPDDAPEALSALSCARAFSRADWAQDRASLYGSGSLEATRDLPRGAGIDTSTPVVLFDFGELAAFKGRLSDLEANTVRGSGGGSLGLVLLSHKELHAMRGAWSKGCCSITVAHELTHTVQDDKEFLWNLAEDTPMATLLTLLCEGSTEAEARMLVDDPDHYDDVDYIRESAFVVELALAARGPEGARDLINRLARAPESTRHLIAAQELLGSEEHVCPLAMAAQRHVNRCPWDAVEMSRQSAHEAIAKLVTSFASKAQLSSRPDGPVM
jgi:hypothetical protein